MKKSRGHIKDLSGILEQIDQVDGEIEQVRRVEQRLSAKKTVLESKLRAAEALADIKVEDKPRRGQP